MSYRTGRLDKLRNVTKHAPLSMPKRQTCPLVPALAMNCGDSGKWVPETA